MSGSQEKHNGEPSSKTIRLMVDRESCAIAKAKPYSLSSVDKSSSTLNRITRPSSSDKSSEKMRSAPPVKGIRSPEIAQMVSSDEEAPNKRKRRLSKRSKSDIIESPSKPTVPLPDVNENISPDDYLLKLVEAQLGLKLEQRKAMEVKDFFHESTEEEKAAYTTEVVTAVRDEQLDHLEKMRENGQELNCFNRFGESLLNLACRRGFQSIVRYLMDQPNVTVKSSDDCGRTPLHDACWHPQAQTTICKWILEEEPALFFIKDKRGCSAFEYARPEHWPVWRKFLLENRESLEKLQDPVIKSMLSKQAL
ncbi:unnamed protein product [Cylindrotheca closterium]|uniref:ANK_REP_REGION domain-containing protein n=1 Tax=Cylindrotheca closterium TaxID=2856 RepID=A0AAD2G922_9STRA|nr:unnamed protein product [Cylindrotheca closterium]